MIKLTDDLDGGPADETIRYALRDVWYEIDLSAENADELTKFLHEFILKSRLVKPSPLDGEPRPGKRRVAPERWITPTEVREWARQEGIEVSGRGRVSAEVVARYREAHGR